MSQTITVTSKDIIKDDEIEPEEEAFMEGYEGNSED